MYRCQNPECQCEFTPVRSDQKHCNPRCRRRAYQISRTNGEKVRSYVCEAPGCENEIKRKKHEVSYSRKHYGCILCDECKANTSLARITVDKGIITDPYEDGLFIPGEMSDYSLVCPLG